MLELNGLRRNVLRWLVVTGIAVSAWSALAPSARADIAIAGDMEVLVPLDVDDVSVGPGFGVRLGYQLHLPLITLVPELGFHWATFDDGPSVYRGTIGGRVGIGELFRFGVTAHLGFGNQSIEIQTVDKSHTGLTLDAGLFLDLTIIPLIDIGVHIEYGRIAGDEQKPVEAFQWLTFGVHAALII